MFRTFWLLRNLSLGGELFLGDGKNAAFLYKFTISRRVAGEPGKRHARRAQVVSDWLNPHSLGIMSAFSFIEN